MGAIFGIGLGLLYGGLFAGVVGTLLPSLARARPALLGRLAPGGRATALLTAVLYVGILYWGLIGAALGGVYHLAEALAPAGGLGSPNAAYTIAVTALALAVVSPVVTFVRRVRLQAALLAAVFAGGFGWLLPLLAA